MRPCPKIIISSFIKSFFYGQRAKREAGILMAIFGARWASTSWRIASCLISCCVQKVTTGQSLLFWFAGRVIDRAHCLRHFFPLCQNDRQDKSNNNKKRRHVCSTDTAFTIIYNSRTVFLTAVSNKTIRIWLIIFGDCFRFRDRWRQSVINTWPSAACQSRAKNRLSASPGLPSTWWTCRWTSPSMASLW